MAKLSAGQRRKLSSSTFGLPGERKYPMPDRSHAVFAEAMASKEEKAGRITPAQKAQIDAKARKKLGAAKRAIKKYASS